MKRLAAAVGLLLLLWITGDSKPSARNNFPQMVRVRLWYLHPPRELKLRADAGQAQLRKCATCKPAPITNLALHATGSRIQIDGEKLAASDLRISGAYQMTAATGPPLRANFPVEVGAGNGRLLITASMPMEEYIAGVLAGETGGFKSDEALKAMAVAARTYAMHFGSRHSLEGFDFCDTTHCQDLRIGAIDAHLRRIADSTAGEILWYDGEPAAAYYSANCGGTTEDGRFILGNNEARAPFLRQHSDPYCLRNGGTQWRSEVSKVELQRALAAEGIDVAGPLRSVSVVRRTPSGRVEFLRIAGRSSSVTVPAVTFRSAIGRHIGWERLKSNWYDVRNGSSRLVFHGRGSGHGVGLCQVGAEVMGEEGHSYREILSFYYPGTQLGISAQGTPWQQLANEDVQLLTTRPERDRVLLPMATRYMHQVEESTGLIYRGTPRLKVYATVADFRNSSGEPGWVAASTRGRTIQMQPSDVLREAGTLESTLHHELLHMLIESYARPGTPLWFREGLALYLTQPESAKQPGNSRDIAVLNRALRAPASEAELRAAYAEAYARIAELAHQHGKEALLDWLQNGLPPELTADRTAQRAGSR
jgi:stage II sporulation protein D (peptidoglycan lytic transglycosylase)